MFSSERKMKEKGQKTTRQRGKKGKLKETFCALLAKTFE